MVSKTFIFLFTLGLLAPFNFLFGQENPFRSLRDSKQEFKAGQKEFSKNEIQNIEQELKDYYLKQRSNQEFKDLILQKPFIQREIISCQKSLKNVIKNCESHIIKILIKRLRSEAIIDDVTFFALNSKENQLDLKQIEQKYFFINLKREEINPNNAYKKFEFNPLEGKDFLGKVGKLKNLTPRQRLYLLYSSEQIIKMADLIKKTSRMMNAKNVQITFDEDGDGKEDLEAIELSYTGKYNLAIKYLKHQIELETSNGILIGKKPTFTDLLTATMEVGYFDEHEMKVLLELKELRDPKVDKYKKALKITWLITKAGIMAIPGYGPLIAIPIVLVEAIIEGNKQSHAKVDNSNDIF